MFRLVLFSAVQVNVMKLLFVCIGNTCRSPMAESVMTHYIRKNDLDWQADSAGLRSWNVGRDPEGRCRQVLKENGLKTHHKGREITLEDFKIFDYIFGMDEHNIQELQHLSTQANSAGLENKAKIQLLGTYIGRKEDEIIRDPYFSSGMSSFHSAYAQINESCRNFIEKHK